MVLNSFEHPHIQVKWSAINVVGQLSIYLAPSSISSTGVFCTESEREKKVRQH
ncbi:hypothetical protein RchiOBHm_Chr3g0475691 [Rosa chinensis]|uniref:Uncharacterized protein n=1 Tax=Rosa chinensis TaxID=74649 RepID=A0A2P6RCF6_ROSCH|nr:hypothetical protein RchiOBHm_Chr3g0475691 [Rosa chinensis]